MNPRTLRGRVGRRFRAPVTLLTVLLAGSLDLGVWLPNKIRR